MHKIVDDVQFHKRRTSHAVDEDNNFMAFVIKVSQDLVYEHLGDFIGRTEFFTMRPRFAMDTNADFHFIISQFKTRFPCSRNRTRFNSHPHRTDIGNDLFSDRFDFRQFGPLFRFCTCNLMDEDRTGYAAAARRIQAIPNGYVIVDDNIIGLDIFISCHFNSHFKIHDIASIILDDAEDALISSHRFDAFQDLVWRR